MTLKADIACGIAATLVSPQDLGQTKFTIGKEADYSLVDGVAADQSDVAFADTRQVGDGATDQLDLNGALEDPNGVAFAPATIKAIYIRSKPTNTTTLKVGPAATNGFIGPFEAAADRVKIEPGGRFMAFAPATGWAVTAATADLLDIDNGAGAAADYEIVLIGTST